MSLHKSLVSKEGLKRHRNVLNRAERIKALQEDDRWDEERSVFGLPKVRHMKVRKKGKDKAKAAEGKTAEGAALEAAPEQEKAKGKEKGKEKGKGKGKEKGKGKGR
ncbi:MAG: small basic protein [Planctomycetota bacterium]